MAVSHRGAISFGMVYIPVGLYTATQDNDIHFNQLRKEDGSRVKYKKVCSGCGKPCRKVARGSETHNKSPEESPGMFVVQGDFSGVRYSDSTTAIIRGPEAVPDYW